MSIQKKILIYYCIMVQYDFAIAYSGCVQNTSFLQIITNKQKIESQVPSVYNDKYILRFGIFVFNKNVKQN